MIIGKLYNIDNGGRVFNIYLTSIKEGSPFSFKLHDYTKNLSNVMFMKKEIIYMDIEYTFLHKDKIIYIYDEVEKETLNFVES